MPSVVQFLPIKISFVDKAKGNKETNRFPPYASQPASQLTTNKFHFTSLSPFEISYQSHYYNAYESKITNKEYCEWLVCLFVALHSNAMVSLGRCWFASVATTHNDDADGRCRRKIDVIVVKNFTRIKTRFQMMRHSSRNSLLTRCSCHLFILRFEGIAVRQAMLCRRKLETRTQVFKKNIFQSVVSRGRGPTR